MMMMTIMMMMIMIMIMMMKMIIADFAFLAITPPKTVSYTHLTLPTIYSV